MEGEVIAYSWMVIDLPIQTSAFMAKYYLRIVMFEFLKKTKTKQNSGVNLGGESYFLFHFLGLVKITIRLFEF